MLVTEVSIRTSCAGASSCSRTELVRADNMPRNGDEGTFSCTGERHLSQWVSLHLRQSYLQVIWKTCDVLNFSRTTLLLVH